MLLLLLVRHALTSITGKRLTGRLPGYGLSEDGRRQAEALAERLSPLPIRAVYASPLERCRETAAAIAAGHRLKVRTSDLFLEVDYGDWQGKTFKSLYKTKAWAELRASPADFRFPGGETIREAQTRGMKATEDLRRNHRRDAVVVCSHADLIRLVVAGYLGLGLDLYTRTSIGPASVTALWFGERGPSLLRLGDTGSFDDLLSRLSARDGLAPRRARRT